MSEEKQKKIEKRLRDKCMVKMVKTRAKLEKNNIFNFVDSTYSKPP